MSNPKNALQERLAKFKGEHSIVYSDVATAGSAFQCTVTITLSWQGISKQWTATSLRSRCSKKESHFETAELLLGDSDLMHHCDVKNWGIPSQSNGPDISGDTDGNFKTRLNELCMRAKVVARYDTTPSAPFLSTVTIVNPDLDESVVVSGLRAGTKKAAEQSAAAVALADSSILVMLGQNPSPKPQQALPASAVTPQRHETLTRLSAANTNPIAAVDINPKGRLLELYAKNQSQLWSSAKSPIFSTSTTPPFVSTLTIELPQRTSADATHPGALVLTGPGCPTKKSAEQAAAGLALRDARVRQMLGLPLLPPAQEKETGAEAPAPAVGATAHPEVLIPAQGCCGVAVAVEQKTAEPPPPRLQPTVVETGDSRAQPAQEEASCGSSLTTVADRSSVAALAVAVDPPRPLPVGEEVANPKGRLLELFARAGCLFGAGPQFRTSTEAPFVSTLVVSLPEIAFNDAIEDANRNLVLTGPERASKKAAEQAVSALALADARIRRAVGLEEPRCTEGGRAGVAGPSPTQQSAVATDGTNHKGKLLELCAKLPPSAQVRPVFSTSTAAPFVCTLQLGQGTAVVGPGRSTKKAAEQAAAALALQDSDIAQRLRAGPGPPPVQSAETPSTHTL